MKAATKLQIANIVAAKAKIKQKDALDIVDKTFETMRDLLNEEKPIQIRGFGSFRTHKTKARIGRNPKNPTVDIHIPEKTVVKFKNFIA